MIVYLSTPLAPITNGGVVRVIVANNVTPPPLLPVPPQEFTVPFCLDSLYPTTKPLNGSRGVKPPRNPFPAPRPKGR